MEYLDYLNTKLYWFLGLDTETHLYALAVLLIAYLILKIYKRRKRKLRKFKRRKLKNNFYNTGFRIIFSAWDIIKFKLRLGDYCDKTGIRYCYQISIKIFKWEYMKIKTQDQNGRIQKRKVTFRS